MELFASLAVRTVSGLIAAFALAFVGMALTGLFVPPTRADELFLLLARIAFIGGGASVGAMIGWAVAVEDRRNAVFAGLLALAGGLSGGWVALMVGEATVEHIDATIRVRQISQTVVIGTTVGANLLPLAAMSARLWWRGR